MPYIGNTIRAADDYRLIDDISSGFNGSATSFALQVAGSAPVPFPKSPQQVLISVNGVIQEPDPTGASGFNLVGTNIVFSSAPTNGHAFFGIIYATADYLNAGGNFPSGSLGAPSFTFIGDENTGLYRKSGGSVGFVSDATEIANFDSNGITISSGDLILGDNRKTKFGVSNDLQIFHDGTDSRLTNATNQLILKSPTITFQDTGNKNQLIARTNGEVELYNNGTLKFETAGHGISIQGGFTATGNSLISDGGKVQFGDGSDLQIYHDSNNSWITDEGTGSLKIRSVAGQVQILGTSSNHNMAVFNVGGSADLYNNNNKKFSTIGGGNSANGIEVFGNTANSAVRMSTSDGTLRGIVYANSDNLIGFLGNNGNWALSVANAGGNTVSYNHLNPSTDSNLDLGTNSVRWRNVYADTLYGDGSNLTNITSTTINNNANNRLITGSGTANTLEGEAELNYSKESTSNHMLVLGGTDNTAAAWSGTRQGFKAIGSQPLLYLVDNGNTSGDDAYVGHSGSSLYIAKKGGAIVFQTASSGFGTGSRWKIDENGHFIPVSNGNYDIGTSSYRVRNLYTSDLHMSNEGSSNDVDQTWGDYTIQEGFEDLYLINNRTGKKFKFNLTEVS